MGCSSSRPFTNIVVKNPDDHSSSLAPLSSSVSYSVNSSPPVHRALSLPMPLVHHPPTKKGDSHHLVSLTSTTYGSLVLIDRSDLKNPTFNCQNCQTESKSQTHHTNSSQSEVKKTEMEQSFSPDSVINTWELMDGLDDDSDDNSKPHSWVFHRPKGVSDKPSSCRYASFDGSEKNLFNSFKFSQKSSSEIFMENISPSDSSKPLWQHLSEEALLAKLDPNVAWSYRQALSSRQLGSNFSRNIRSMDSSPLNSSSFCEKLCLLSSSEDRIIIYFTSLRGIRKTHEDCCSVKMIFRSFRVAVDERDISMDSSYKKELQNALGGKTVSLPQVFIRGKHVGGAEEIKQLNEAGGLAKPLEGFPIQDSWFVCEFCGDSRFLPCPNCKGSRKIFEEEEGELRRCPDCNENGLIRCPSCC